MSYQEKIENKILSVEWKHEDRYSNTLLLKEILRRYCLWLNFFDQEFMLGSILSFFDKSISAEDFKVDKITQHLSKFSVSVYLRPLLFDAIGWGYLLDNQNSFLVNSSLPHLHEPILSFYERGGFIYMDKLKYLHSDRVSFNRYNISRFYQEQPFVSLDDKSLDALDLLKD